VEFSVISGVCPGKGGSAYKVDAAKVKTAKNAVSISVRGEIAKTP